MIEIVEAEERQVEEIESDDSVWLCRSVLCKATIHPEPHEAHFLVLSKICEASLEICSDRHKIMVQEDGWRCLPCDLNHTLDHLTVVPLNF
jgi:hypothetical protein